MQWLSADEGSERRIAADLFFDGELLNKDEIILKLKAEEFDFAFQDSALRDKKLLVADMDSTIIQVECIDELADFAGLKEKISAITEAAMQGKLDFEEALRERVHLLKGLSTDNLERAYQERVKLTSGAMILIQTLKKNNVTSLLISGGFTFFTEKIAALTGFDVNRANILGIKDGKLTGEIVGTVVDSQTKINSLHEFAKKQSLLPHETIAVGDGANDIPMIKGAGLGIAYHAKEAAANAADISLRHSDLTALLYIMGIKQEDFSAAS